MRQFRDDAGVEWQVFLTEPPTGPGPRDKRLPEAFRSGWLCFESASDKRRLAPVPPNWATLSDEELALLCSRAASQAPRSHTSKESRAESQPEDRAGDRASIAADLAEPLRPELRKAEQQLDKSLEEVCVTPSVDKLNTGQLIRVEETLALAADAAKTAVSLRRKLRLNREDASRRERTGSDEVSGEAPPPTP